MTASTVLDAPLHWQAHEANAYRACDRCCHGTSTPAGRCCTHPQVAHPQQPVPTPRARALGGACGPEADLATGLW